MLTTSVRIAVRVNGGYVTHAAHVSTAHPGTPDHTALVDAALAALERAFEELAAAAPDEHMRVPWSEWVPTHGHVLAVPTGDQHGRDGLGLFPTEPECCDEPGGVWFVEGVADRSRSAA